MSTTESVFPDQSDFDYVHDKPQFIRLWFKCHLVLSLVDYETLRTTGVVLAIIMFVSGIVIALSKKFTKCVKSSSNSSSSGTQIPKTEVPPQTV
ncbi:FXYD domain containing ion transport regulator 7 [Thunnus maccoyii]|uniref:FXYD domain containing ion transport regulator 7 n=1 Tax=Thunnus maccoyii TaxID=8240 RepID=UPI001C4DC7C8|nr:FXYD domain containing ion transport regulator 7 [Thunnus maccoyii]